MMEYFLLFIFIFVLTCINQKQFHSYLAPATFMNGVWFVFYFLHLVIGDGYYISMTSVVVVLLLLCCFNIGTWISQSVPLRNYIYEMNISPQTNSKIRNFIFYFTIVSIIASLHYLYIFISHCGGIAMYFLSDIRSEMLYITVPFYVRIPMLFSYTLTLVAAIYYVKFGGIIRFVFTTLPILICSIAQNGRAGFLMMIFIMVMTSALKQILNRNMNYRSINRLIIRYGVYLSIFGAIFFIIGLIIRLRNADASDSSFFLDSFKSYLLGGISSFDTYIHKPVTLGTGYGRYNFSSLYGLLGIAVNEVGVYTDYLVFNKAGDTTNIFTMLRPVLDDFGYIGGCVYMIILGYIGQRMYRLTIRKDETALSFMILFYTFLFHSPLLPITVHTSILFSFFLPSIILKCFSQRKYNEI